MNERMRGPTRRRGELLARIEAQRGQLAEIASSWEKPLALADHGVSALRVLRRHPLLVAGAVAAGVAYRKGVAGLAGRVWMLWKGYRYFSDLRQRP